MPGLLCIMALHWPADKNFKGDQKRNIFENGKKRLRLQPRPFIFPFSFFPFWSLPGVPGLLRIMALHWLADGNVQTDQKRNIFETEKRG